MFASIRTGSVLHNALVVTGTSAVLSIPTVFAAKLAAVVLVGM